jgi:hypothetical protein
MKEDRFSGVLIDSSGSEDDFGVTIDIVVRGRDVAITRSRDEARLFAFETREMESIEKVASTRRMAARWAARSLSSSVASLRGLRVRSMTLPTSSA